MATSLIREGISKVQQEMKERVIDPISAKAEQMGLKAPKQRQAYQLDAAEGSEKGKPTRNLATVWVGKEKVEIKDIGYPKMQTPWGVPINHGVILKVVASCICGSDLHMYRDTIPGVSKGMVFGHEITGEVFDMGEAVERFDIGDLVSVPFNVSCGKCDNCREMKSNACLKANPDMPGGAFGYALMGGWQGGQAEYVLVPWADFSLLKLPKLEQVAKKLPSLALLTDVFPTGFNGAVQAGVCAGSIVYIAGAGPVGLCAARSCFLLGAAEVFISDLETDRLKLAESIGCKTIDLKQMTGGKLDSASVLAEITRQLPPWKNGPHKIVDCSIECVGYECCGLGKEVSKRIDEQALNTCFAVTKAGGKVGIPGVYPPADLGGGSDEKSGVYHIQFGAAWNKGLQLGMGQCPVANYHKDLMKTILHDRVDLEGLLNTKIISLDEVPQAYKNFNEREAVKYIIDPHGMLTKYNAAKGASVGSSIKETQQVKH